jgi:hypothetical protein
MDAIYSTETSVQTRVTRFNTPKTSVIVTAVKTLQKTTSFGSTYCYILVVAYLAILAGRERSLLRLPDHDHSAQTSVKLVPVCGAWNPVKVHDGSCR